MCHLVHAIECYLVLFSVILCFLVLSHAISWWYLLLSPNCKYYDVLSCAISCYPLVLCLISQTFWLTHWLSEWVTYIYAISSIGHLTKLTDRDRLRDGIKSWEFWQGWGKLGQLAWPGARQGVMIEPPDWRNSKHFLFILKYDDKDYSFLSSLSLWKHISFRKW